MPSQRSFFHGLFLLLLLLLVLLSGSVFSTLSLLPSTSSAFYHWKSLPIRKSSRPQIYGSEERLSASVDGFVKSEPDSGSSEPPYGASEAEQVRSTDGGESEGKREGRAGQLEPRAGTDPGRGKVGEHRGLRIDEGEKSWSGDVKRKLEQNSVEIWGKRENADRERRKWGENSMRVWGKRTAPNEKRKWGENTMGVWGKRSPDEKEKEEEEKVAAETEIAPSGSRPEVTGSSLGQTGSSINTNTPRRLRKRSVFDWYNDGLDLDRDRDLYLERDLSKRSQGRGRSYPRPYGGPKRNWETNTMKVWGKRNYPIIPWEEKEEEEDYFDAKPVYGNKRKWTSDNAIRIWG